MQFFCEVPVTGRAAHLRVKTLPEWRRFGEAVEKALRQGKFIPAKVNGENTPVLVGGTVLFVHAEGRPTVVVSLATAEASRTTQNYIQPQLRMSWVEMERKMETARYGINFRPSTRPGAEILMEVDASGNVTSSKIQGEHPEKGGSGLLMLKTLKDAKFIPARANGSPTAGQFKFLFDLRLIRFNRTPTGTRIPDHS